jgi:hypothetical protein
MARVWLQVIRWQVKGKARHTESGCSRAVVGTTIRRWSEEAAGGHHREGAPHATAVGEIGGCSCSADSPATATEHR